MERSNLKNFAINVRNDLQKKIENKITSYYLNESFDVEQKGDLYTLKNEIISFNFSKEEYRKRELLKQKIKSLGLNEVVEEAAFTWFNRIIAIRYMEVNNILPLSKDNQSIGIRILSSYENEINPDILKFSNLINPDLDINYNKDKYLELKDNRNELFRYILLLVCEKLKTSLPQVFGDRTEYIDILLPDNLLNETGLVAKLIKEIPEEDFKKVEILGWLYQYYNTEKKSMIESKIANGYKMSKDDVPAKTQLFTPEWLVKYMVENALGCIFKQSDKKVINDWKYFQKNNNINVNFELESLKIIDPCCGSGHILVYIFEKLFELYLARGYNKNEICKKILENNIYGLDIDERAYQLSALSLYLKAREYDKNLFNENIKLNLMSFVESNNFNYDALQLIEDNEMKEISKYLLKKFGDAREYGSILKIERYDYSKLMKYLSDIEKKYLNILEINWFNDIKNILIPICKTAIILSNKYECLITNPPYLSSGDCSTKLNKYLSKEYSIAKKDLYATFMITDFLVSNGIQAMINQHNWMFLSSYKDLREKFINNYKLINAVHLGTKAFDEISGEKVQSVMFVFQNQKAPDYVTSFIKLDDFHSPKLKEDNYLKIINNNLTNFIFNVNIQDFKSFESYSFVYWTEKKIMNIFKNDKKIMNFANAKQGMATGNNEKFVRNWFEVEYNKIGFNFHNIEDFHNSDNKYVPYIKSSGITKWWGNYFNILKFDQENYKLLSNSGNKLPSRQFYFKDNVNWSLISTDKFGARFADFGGVFDVGAHAIYTEDPILLEYLGGFLNTKIFNYFVKCMNPTLNYNSGAVQLIPYRTTQDKELYNSIIELKEIFKKYWNYNEYSWNFKKNYLKRNGNLKDAVTDFCIENKNTFLRVKELEQLINNKFINLFNLTNEIDVSIYDSDITLKRYTELDIIKELISYSVGCMFGRYSLDEEGLIYAGGEFDENKYIKFKADSDNIIPITDEVYFDDDIVQRFKQFIEVSFGKETLNENLDFIAETLEKKGTETSEETIRRYFVNDFFNDHCKIYQKRPIYWLLDSGKKNGFKALIYMHRYNENLIPKARLDYLHRIQTTYEKLLSDVNYKLTTDLSMVDKKDAQKRQEDLNA